LILLNYRIFLLHDSVSAVSLPNDPLSYVAYYVMYEPAAWNV